MTEQQLLMLPNKDLWRGNVRAERAPVVDTTTITTEELSPLDKAFKAVVDSAKGGPLNCLWCGQGFNASEMLNHLDRNHPSVTHPMGNAEVAMHQVAQGQKELEAARE